MLIDQLNDSDLSEYYNTVSESDITDMDKDMEDVDDYFNLMSYNSNISLQEYIDMLGIEGTSVYFETIIEMYQSEMDEENIDGSDIVTDDDIMPGNLEFKYSIQDEGSNMVEIIQDVVTGVDIPIAYDEAYEIIETFIKNDYKTSSGSGLHMSISYKNGSHTMDFVKFILLSNIYNVLRDDPAATRDYVRNIFMHVDELALGEDFLKEIIDMSENNIENIMSEDIHKYLEDHFKFYGSTGIKFKSVNKQHYFTQDGRVELRFFGGEDYEDKKDEYFDILIRCMYALKLACDPNEKRKEYLGTLYRFANKRFENKYGLSIASYKSNLEKSKQLLGKISPADREDIAEISHPVSNDSRIYSKWYTYINVLRGLYSGNFEYSKGSNEFVDYLTSCMRFYKTHTR